MRTFSLHREILLAHDIDKVFAFFGDPANLERLTPRWLKFEVLTPPVDEVKPGLLIDYRLKVRGIPIRWQSEITIWEPPYRFVDEQRRGPYRMWHHEHTFTSQGGGTLCGDRVDYAVPGGRLVNRFFVAPDLKRIFDFRHSRMKEIFPDPA